MKNPVVGIIANFFLINDQYPAQTSGNMNIEAIAQVAGAVPMIIPCLSGLHPHPLGLEWAQNRI